MNLNPFFDIRTLYFVQSAVLLALSISMIQYYYSRKTYNGFGVWSFSIVLLSLGVFLVALRNSLPDLVTVIIANSFVMIGMFQLYYGFSLFERIKIRKYMHLGLIFILSSIVFPVLTYTSPNVNLRIVIDSAISVFYFLLCINILLKAKINKSYWSGIPLVSIIALLALLRLIRGGIFLSSSTNVTNLMNSGASLGIITYIQIFLTILFVICLIQSNSQKLEEEYLKSIDDLELAVQEVKTLQGFIPICSYCHGIRDDKGLWTKLEEYISKNSKAKFSHGICPECYKKEMVKLDSMSRDT